MTVTALVLVAVISAAILSGCVGIEDFPAHSQLVGTWKVHGASGDETLVLSADGKYTQDIRDWNGVHRTNSGTWSDYVNGEPGTSQPHIVLHAALVQGIALDTLPPGSDVDKWYRGDWLLWTVRDWGRPGLSPHPDLASFEKR